MSEDPLLGSLLSDSRPLVRRLVAEPLLDEATLRGQLEDHAARLRALRAEPRALADFDTASLLTEQARGFLARWARLDHRGRRLVQVAVRYLVLEDDGDADLESPFGFDDDREVFDAVARALGSGG